MGTVPFSELLKTWGGGVKGHPHLRFRQLRKEETGRWKRLGSGSHVVCGTPKDSDRAWGALTKARRTQCV